MTFDELKEIRLSGQRPANIIKLSLCKGDQFNEPVIRIKLSIQPDDYKTLRNLVVDVCYWNRACDELKLIEILKVIPVHSIYAVNHKIKKCVLVYYKGETLVDDLSFLYDFERVNPYAT